MADPMMFSMESLLAERDMDIGAGLPESVRRELGAAKENSRRAKELVNRLDRLISDYEAFLAEGQRRLQELHRQRAEVMAGLPAA